MYDVLILSVMTVGILAMAVFSYKIFHSRAYPVGMVREIPTSQHGTLELEDVSDQEGTTQRIFYSDVWAKRHNQETAYGLFEKGKKRKIHLRFYGGGEPSFPEKPQGSPLEEKVTEHEEALKVYSKQVENLEKRLRRLEAERVQKFQEATEEEKPEAPQVVH